MKVTKPILGTPEMEEVKKIWMEAFPPEEREMGLETILSNERAHINAYYDNDTLVGFTVLIDFDWFDYASLFAVNANLRGGGYGGKIWDSVLQEHTTRPLYFAVEDPDELPAENTEQRVKRVRFYEKHGCKITDLEYTLKTRFRLMYYHTPERAQEAKDYIISILCSK